MFALQTLALTKKFGSKTVCDHISLSVHTQEIFGFLGPNGAGKSTFVKTVLGLVPLTDGRIRILGKPPTDFSVRIKIGYLPELFRYPPWLTALEVVMFHARLMHRGERVSHRQLVEACGKALDEVGLLSRGKDRVKTFSKGMQQRLGLAVALIAEPEVLFLDEPSSALDPVGRHDVAELLRKVKSQGTSVFLNSHLLSEMETLCDRVALIDHGKLIYTGTLQEALQGSGICLVRTGDLSEDALARLRPFGLINAESQSGQYLLEFDVKAEGVPLLVRQLTNTGVDIYAVESVRRSLETWFLERLGVQE